MRKLNALRISVSTAVVVSFAMPATSVALPFPAPAKIPQPILQEQAESLPQSEELEAMMADAEIVAQNTTQKRRATAPAPRRSSGTSSGTARTAPARTAAPGRSAPTPTSTSSASQPSRTDPTLAKALNMAKAGQYQDASKLLFQLSRSPKHDRESAQIKYILGLMLYEMKLYQAAAFVFYDVVRQESRSNPKSRYLRQSLEKIALAADELDSDVLLRFAIKQIKEDEFPAASRDMLFYRLGEIKMQEKDYAAATREFVKVRQGSLFYYKARYKLALALAEAKALDKAQLAFEDLAEQTKVLGVTDPTRVSALLGRSRVLYQKKQFDEAIEAYRDVPRDTEQWHEALFESTWAMMLSARFRSALSNFHSLHSAYYEDFYQPESLILRAIVYLYICKYDEMEKTLGLFERIYRPVGRDVRAMLESVTDPLVYYRELAKISERFDSLKATDRAARRGYQIPFLVARQILKEGDVRRTFNYLENLDTERRRLASMPAAWRGAAVGLYAKNIVDKRLRAAQTFAGRLIRHHMVLIQSEVRDLVEQTGYLRFEGLASKKETLRKEIAGKGLEKERVDEDTNRNYYVQNGYEYWPFKGEYWLDEIGNYQYVGVKKCD